jgi:nitrite reductase/ring-hydroxylating ferredoxin subunit
LEKGTVDGNELVCPWHSARFCVQTGVKKSGPGWCDLATYPVRVTEGLVEIGLTIDVAPAAAPEAFPGLEPAPATA